MATSAPIPPAAAAFPHSTPSQVRWHAAEPADELNLDGVAAHAANEPAEPVKLHAAPSAAATKSVADASIQVPVKDGDSARPPLLAGSRYVFGPRSPLESANFLSMLTVWWVSALVVLGNKRTLQDSDVPELPEVDSAPACFSNFSREWEATRVGGAQGSLSRALRRAFGFWWWMAAFYCVIANVFLILAPIFVQKIVGVLEDHSIPAWEGYLWSMALVLTTFLSSLFTNQQMFASIRAGNRVRVACITAIYNKSLTLSRASRQLQSTGSTVNVMSNDSSRLFDITLLVHFLWIAPILIIVPLALMISIVGVAAVAGVALLCLLSPLQAYVSRRTGENRRAMLKFSDQRVKLMNEILQGIRVVKLYSWEAALAARIQEVRAKELRLVRIGLYLQAVNQCLMFCTPPLVSAVIMCTYAGLGNEVTASKTFGILALLNILRGPTVVIPMSVSALAEARVSSKRIATFLRLDELPPRRRQPRDASLPYAIAFRRPCSFVWAPLQSPPTLKDIQLNIPTGSLVAIIGLVGSGKTSLVSAMLGEMLQTRPEAEGAAAAAASSSSAPPESDVLINGSIAYVSQESWIRNDTVRGNILFDLPFDEERYGAVLDAACLRHDLSILPQADLTEIGERGINLSGGQRARVSIARALYRQRLCDIYLMDDPFAAVDMTVGAHIFQHALQGMLKDKTRVVVLSSHLHLLEHFDQIIVVEQLPGEAAANGAAGEDGVAASDSPHANGSAQPLLGATPASAAAAVAPSSSASPDSPNKPRSNGSGRIAAIGTFAELKAQWASLMSQRDEEAEPLDAVDEEGDAVGIDDELPGVAEPGLQSRMNSVDGSGAASPATPGSGEHGGLGLMQPKRQRTTSGAARSQKSRLRSHMSGSRSRSQAAESLEQEAKQIAAAALAARQLKEREEEAAAMKDHSALIEKEDRAQGAVGWEVWASYFSAGQRSAAGVALLVFIGLLFLLAQAARIGCDIWLSLWSAKSVWVDRSSSDFWILIYFLIVAATIILSAARSFIFVAQVALRSSARIHAQAFGLLMRGSIPLFYDITPIGRVLNRFSKDLDQLDTLLPTTLFGLLQNVGILLGVLAVCIAGSIWMLPLFVPIALAFLAVQRYFRNSQRELKRIENTTRSPIFSLFSETLTGLSVIRAYGVEAEFRTRNNETVQMNSKVFSILWWSQRWIALRLDWVSLLVVIAVAFLVVSLRDTLSVGVASLALVYSLQFTGLLQMTVRNSVDSENYLTSVERLLAFKNIAVEAPAIIAETEPPKGWPERGEIELRDLQMRYRPHLPLVLKGVSCRIQPQEKIGICGRTGSGKSSLLVALFRLVEAAGGEILIDGVNIATIGLDSLRSKLSIIPQDPVMFSDSLRRNCDPFGRYTDAEIHEALKRVHLSSMVEAFPEGLAHEISEGGENLSQGQRQLVCIARALLRNSRIIVLDEATSSVDAETDTLIQTAIRDNFKHATVLTIAHRIETIVDADRIMLLADGKLIEFDTPSKLLSADSDSAFKKLVAEGGAANLARLQALAREADHNRAKEHKAHHDEQE